MAVIAEEDAGISVFDVRAFGALGDGVTDDTLAIQLAINAASQNAGTGGSPDDPFGKGGVVVFPPGRYIIKDTLVIEGQAGLQFRGSGLMPSNDITLGHFGPRVWLIWKPDSPPTDPIMLHINGCSGITLSDLAFFGAEQHAFANVRLIRIDDLGAHPAIMNTFRRVALNNAKVGIEFGNVTSPCVLFELVAFDWNSTGLKVTEDTSAVFLFNYVGGSYCPTVMDLQEGGCVDVHICQMVSCGGEGVDDWCLKFGHGGPGLRCSRLQNVHIEQGTEQLLKVSGDHRIVLSGYTEGASNCHGKIYVDGASLSCIGCSFHQKPLLSWGATTRQTTARFRDCRFDQTLVGGVFPIADWIDNPAKTGCSYSLERCDANFNVPIDDDRTAW